MSKIRIDFSKMPRYTTPQAYRNREWARRRGLRVRGGIACDCDWPEDDPNWGDGLPGPYADFWEGIFHG